MRVLPFKIPKPEQGALVFQVDNSDTFYDKFHQHEEIQISFIVEGEGTLVVGNSINHYSKGDIIIIGSFLPHVLKSDTKTSKISHMLTLFFTKSDFGNQFFDLEELKELASFFKRAKHGFKVTSNLKLIEKLFFKLEKASKLNRFLILLQLLKITSKATYKSLSTFIYDKKYTDNEGYRMRNVFEFTMNNFEKEITLEEIAEVANMTKNAFCKYFKKRTNKTYFQFLNELRIENACKLLLSNKDLSIIQIAEASGFNNMSNFNRQFKSIKKKKPSEFKKVHSIALKAIFFQ
ncbi:AraC family transcriptional regulator [uncultured Polaribacter sp.]|uniref:AraC family transcriptional regulator n=1 Tax=uncultured Polaribacter sp. TaxID=174711 RepID=UPI002603DB2B|nr:helix-turn-helix transcriptional regulator [uncultured Polaribacter sp.]